MLMDPPTMEDILATNVGLGLSSNDADDGAEVVVGTEVTCEMPNSPVRDET